MEENPVTDALGAILEAAEALAEAVTQILDALEDGDE